MFATLILLMILLKFTLAQYSYNLTVNIGCTRSAQTLSKYIFCKWWVTDFNSTPIPYYDTLYEAMYDCPQGYSLLNYFPESNERFVCDKSSWFYTYSSATGLMAYFLNTNLNSNIFNEADPYENLTNYFLCVNNNSSKLNASQNSTIYNCNSTIIYEKSKIKVINVKKSLTTDSLNNAGILVSFNITRNTYCTRTSQLSPKYIFCTWSVTGVDSTQIPFNDTLYEAVTDCPTNYSLLNFFPVSNEKFLCEKNITSWFQPYLTDTEQFMAYFLESSSTSSSFTGVTSVNSFTNYFICVKRNATINSTSPTTYYCNDTTAFVNKKLIFFDVEQFINYSSTTNFSETTNVTSPMLNEETTVNIKCTGNIQIPGKYVFCTWWVPNATVTGTVSPIPYYDTIHEAMYDCPPGYSLLNYFPESNERFVCDKKISSWFYVNLTNIGFMSYFLDFNLYVISHYYPVNPLKNLTNHFICVNNININPISSQNLTIYNCNNSIFYEGRKIKSFNSSIYGSTINFSETNVTATMLNVQTSTSTITTRTTSISIFSQSTRENNNFTNVTSVMLNAQTSTSTTTTKTTSISISSPSTRDNNNSTNVTSKFAIGTPPPTLLATQFINGTQANLTIESPQWTPWYTGNCVLHRTRRKINGSSIISETVIAIIVNLQLCDLLDVEQQKMVINRYKEELKEEKSDIKNKTEAVINQTTVVYATKLTVSKSFGTVVILTVAVPIAFILINDLSKVFGYFRRKLEDIKLKKRLQSLAASRYIAKMTIDHRFPIRKINKLNVEIHKKLQKIRKEQIELSEI